ncbi:response regulator [Candidatus Woesearchaeota archaeon]|nr:response regulator [Candidatus Woesearchaeota archaeon]
MKFLIVDDSNLTHGVLDNYIKRSYDAELVEAKTGEQAMEKFIEEQPDICFIDIVLPGMDGVKVIRKIIGIDPNAKIIAISSDQENEQPAINAGARIFLKKPLATHVVLGAIEKLKN